MLTSPTFAHTAAAHKTLSRLLWRMARDLDGLSRIRIVQPLSCALYI